MKYDPIWIIIKFQDKKNKAIARSKLNTMIKMIKEIQKVGGKARGRRWGKKQSDQGTEDEHKNENKNQIT